MTDNLKPGEYVGVNGLRRWWQTSGGYYYHDAKGDINKSDLRAAGEALIALADEAEIEYVSLDDGNHRLVIRGDSVTAQEYRTPSGASEPGWYNARYPLLVAAEAFRAGVEWAKEGRAS